MADLSVVPPCCGGAPLQRGPPALSVRVRTIGPAPLPRASADKRDARTGTDPTMDRHSDSCQLK